MMALFLVAFSGYGYCLRHAWRVARLIRRQKRRWHSLHNDRNDRD
ncbi:undecaprenyl-phosphate alpha-N-acetylglucosaminyl 1-phosphate transferase [Tatumella ptyseos]|nr:undecaprenyl-phosphate alpha-N-acetylglucosaminyl 1-phosphate transferase [Tatumella ptyseos]